MIPFKYFSRTEVISMTHKQFLKKKIFFEYLFLQGLNHIDFVDFQQCFSKDYISTRTNKSEFFKNIFRIYIIWRTEKRDFWLNTEYIFSKKPTNVFKKINIYFFLGTRKHGFLKNIFRGEKFIQGCKWIVLKYFSGYIFSQGPTYIF